MIGVGLGAASVVKSPQQVAAEAQPPARNTLTAPVERRELTDTVVTRGQVSAGRTIEVSPTGFAGEGAGAAVVTKVRVEAGDKVTAGKVLLEISGRPVFALEGALPVYRDLKPGSHGDDVAQLQRGLARLGFDSGADRRGKYGAGTKAAVERLYESFGYDPVPAQPDGKQQLKEAASAVKVAERAVEDVEDTTGKERALEDLAEAQENLKAAQQANGPMVPAGEVVFLPQLPGRIDTLGARVGGPVGENLLTLSAGKLVITGQLGQGDRGLVRVGQKVEILSEITGIEVGGTVTTVTDERSVSGSGPAGDGTGNTQGGGADKASATGYSLLVTPDKPLPTKLAHQDVRLTIKAASSQGEVLVVPLSAVSAGADAETTVTVLETGGQRRRVPVRPGISGDGYVQVAPVGEARLGEGDKVVVGMRST